MRVKISLPLDGVYPEKLTGQFVQLCFRQLVALYVLVLAGHPALGANCKGWGTNTPLLAYEHWCPSS